MSKTDRMKYTDIKKRVFDVIQIGYSQNVISVAFDIFITGVILLNLFIVFFETFDASVPYADIIDRVELVTLIIFAIEYALRLWTAEYLYPNEHGKVRAVIHFIFSIYGLIDLITFLPGLLSMYFAVNFPLGIVAFRMLRVVRIFRLFRINRYYDAFNVINDVLREKKKQILSAVMIIFMLLMASSLIMYNLEHNAQPDSFRNAFSGMWWAVSTLLTVGYGDIYPITAAGRLVGIVLAFLGVGIVAVPTGIISAGFVEQYTKVKNIAATEDEYPIHFITIPIDEDNAWVGKRVADLGLTTGMLLVAIIRGNRTIVPKGTNPIQVNDRLVIAARAFERDSEIRLKEIYIREDSKWVNKTIKDFGISEDLMVVMIIRKDRSIIPNGNIGIHCNDKLLVVTKHVNLM